MPKLSDADIATALAGLGGWSRAGDTLTKRFTFAGFPSAIAFVVRVALAAEAMNHHPDLDIRWATVVVHLSTHDAGGITALDVQLAGQIDGCAAG
jgi:4a-hydroxytetrahydrobiopterin dehydratase